MGWGEISADNEGPALSLLGTLLCSMRGRAFCSHVRRNGLSLGGMRRNRSGLCRALADGGRSRPVRSLHGGAPLGRCLSRFLLFLFSLFLWRLLNAGKFTQDFYAIFVRFALSGELRGKQLFNDGVKLRSPGHADGLQLGDRRRQSRPDGPPFLNVRPNFGESLRIGGLRQKVRHLLKREFFEKPIGINGGARATAREFPLRLQRCVLEIQYRSEEHTSELQSLAYLVCRLLLEKKKAGGNNAS